MTLDAIEKHRLRNMLAAAMVLAEALEMDLEGDDAATAKDITFMIKEAVSFLERRQIL